MLRRPFVLALCVFSFCRPAFPVIERVLGIEMGGGFPQLLLVQAVVRAWPPIQIGMGFGPYGPFLRYPFSLPSSVVTMADGLDYSLAPTGTVGLSSFCPFVRVFPTERNYYLEFNLVSWQISISYSSDVTQILTNTLIPKTIIGSVNIYQTIPTLSIGHIFTGKAYFLNIALGMSFPSLTFTFSDVLLLNPALVGGAAANASVTSAIGSGISSSASQTLQPFKTRYPILPSVFFTFGIFL